MAKRDRLRLSVIFLLLLLSVLPPNVVLAADGEAQLKIVTQYPVETIHILGLNQNDEVAEWIKIYSPAENVTEITTNDWWWRFKWFCPWWSPFCDEDDFPEIAPYVWIWYTDGGRENKPCAKTDIDKNDNWVTCEFSYTGSGDPGGGDPGGGDPGGGDPGGGDPGGGDPGGGDPGGGDPPSIPVRPDLSIAEVTPIQAVSNSNFDSDSETELILNKPLAARVKVNIDKDYLLSDGYPIELQVSFQGQTVTESLLVSSLKGGQDAYIVFMDGPTTIASGNTVSVVVDPSDSLVEDDEANNTNTATSVDVVGAHGMGLACVRVGLDNPSVVAPGSGEVSNRLSNEWIPYLRAVFPVPPAELTYNLLSSEFLVDFPVGASQQDLCSGLYGGAQIVDLCKLLAAVYFQGQSSVTNNGRVLGIATGGFFNQVLPSHGFTLSGLEAHYPVAMVGMTGFMSTLAHETAHTYGLPDRTGNSEAVDGYWVDRRQTVPSTDLMRSGQSGRWIVRSDYEYLYPRFSNPSTVSMQPALLIAGSILADGEVAIFGPYFAPEGLPIATGEALILETLDTDGNIVSETPFGTFTHLAADGGDEVELGVTVFTFASSFPAEAVGARIADGEAILFEFNIHTSLLRQAIASIPDEGFVRNPDQRRNALYNQIDALEQQYERANLNGVINHLYELHDKADKWLDPGCETQSVIDYSHAKVLVLINELIVRMEQIQTSGVGQ